MEKVLEISGLCKKYPAFELKDVGFSLDAGRIMGFIGRNGAGKTTTLKSMLNLVHPDAGDIRFFGRSLAEDETGIKRQIGFVSGGVDYYPASKLSVISSVTKKFYPDWDDGAYRRYLDMFELLENKTPAQLSAGMKVKYALTLALSHNARLLVLDEPTSGLDPVSRDDLLDVFLTLEDEGISILFSTHITSDLDKCADDITYIKDGRILATGVMRDFIGAYRAVELTAEQRESMSDRLIGAKRAKTGFTAIVSADDEAGLGVPCREATLEDIMIHMDKEGETK